MGDRSSMSITADSPSGETLKQGPLALLLRRQYEFPFRNKIFFFFNFSTFAKSISNLRYRQPKAVLFYSKYPFGLLHFVLTINPWHRVHLVNPSLYPNNHFCHYHFPCRTNTMIKIYLSNKREKILWLIIIISNSYAYSLLDPNITTLRYKTRT